MIEGKGVHYGKVNRILRRLGKKYVIKCRDGDEIAIYHYPLDENGLEIFHYPMVDGLKIIDRISTFHKVKEVLRGNSDYNYTYEEGAWITHVDSLISGLPKKELRHKTGSFYHEFSTE